MLHSSTLYLVRPMVELAERISALSGIPDAKVFFVNSGSEANDTALQLCCTARRSNQVLALRNSYHGRSFASMAATGLRTWSSSSLTPVNVSYVHGGYRYRSPFGHLPTPSTPRPAPRTCRMSSAPPPPATWPASSPSRFRAWPDSWCPRTGSSRR